MRFSAQSEMVNEDEIYGLKDEFEKVWKINRNIFKQSRSVRAKFQQLNDVFCLELRAVEYHFQSSRRKKRIEEKRKLI